MVNVVHYPEVAARAGQTAEGLLAAVLARPEHDGLDVFVSVDGDLVVDEKDLLVALVQGWPQRPGAVVAEVPLPHGEVLEHAHAGGNPALHPHHERLLSGECEEEVDEVGGQGLEEEDDEGVGEPVGPARAVRVPQDGVERVLADAVLAQLDDLPPGNALHFVGRDVVDRRAGRLGRRHQGALVGE